MRTDVNAFLGAYPFRREAAATAARLLEAMDRVDTYDAWVSWLPAVTGRETGDKGIRPLEAAVRGAERLRPVPSLAPGRRGWERGLARAKDLGAPAVRCDPTFLELDPCGPEMRAVVDACAANNVPLMLAVRLEDGRQRVPEDTSPELPPWAVRTLVRHNRQARLIVTHADRGFIEEVHFGSTPEEAERLWWDIAWIWGPPEDHLETLVGTMGVGRFVFGSGMPLRLPDAAVAKLDLLDLAPAVRAAVERGNVERLAPGPRPS
ncbi:MAG: amidohydrolase family protein [Gemmatimonadales bacterium]